MVKRNRASHYASQGRKDTSSANASSSYRSRAHSSSQAQGMHSASSRYSQHSARNSQQSTHSSSGAHAYSRDSYGSGASTSAYSADRYVGARRGMSRGKKIAIGIVIALAVVLVGAGVAAAVWYNNIANNISAKGDITNLAAPAADEPYYVMLIGSDSREGFDEEPVGDSIGERTDSIMVARVDEKNQKVSIVSMPRDLRVYVDGHGYCKINSAVDYGGYDTVVRLLNGILGININYYAKIYFNGFEELVDTLGGVTVDVPEGTTYNYVDVPAGENVTINGIQALTLARCRHGWPEDQGAYAMGDYQRTLNQRNLVKAIAKKVLEQDVTKIPELITSISHCVETNMGVEKIVSLAVNMKGMDTDEIDSAQLPIGASTIDDEWYALMYQDVFELVDKNFTSGEELFKGLDNFNPECNDDDVDGNYIEGPVYSYTTYSAEYGSPYSISYTPSALTQEAIEKTSSGVLKGSHSSTSSSSKSKSSSYDDDDDEY